MFGTPGRRRAACGLKESTWPLKVDKGGLLATGNSGAPNWDMETLLLLSIDVLSLIACTGSGEAGGVGDALTAIIGTLDACDRWLRRCVQGF